MIINILKTNLLEALLVVQKALAVKNIQEELTGILFKTEKDKLNLFATDLDMSIETSAPVIVKREGSIILPGNKLIEIIRKLPDTEIEIEELVDTKSVIIRYGHNKKIELKGWSAEYFPLLPMIESKYSFELEREGFKDMIRETIFACALDEKRSIYSGILFELEDNKLSLVASDTFRLVLKTTTLKTDVEQPIRIIIPRRALNELIRIEGEDEKISVYGNDAKIYFRNGDTVILTNLIKGTFPDYKTVFPSGFKTEIKVNKENLIGVLERAYIFGDETDKNKSFKLYISDGLLRIESESAMGNIDEEIEIETEGEKQEARFRTNFYLDALKVVPADEITLKYIGPLEAAIMEYDDSFKYLILPLRT